jgi:hypothetical protein
MAHPNRGRRLVLSRVRNQLVGARAAIGEIRMLPDEFASINGEIWQALKILDRLIARCEAATALEAS